MYVILFTLLAFTVKSQSVAGKEELSAAKRTKFNDITLRIAKWLPGNEFNKLKQLWQQCDTLNSKKPALLNGKRPYCWNLYQFF